MARGLAHTQGLDRRLARLRGAVEEVLDDVDLVLAVAGAAEARGRA